MVAVAGLPQLGLAGLLSIAGNSWSGGSGKHTLGLQLVGDAPTPREGGAHKGDRDTKECRGVLNPK